MFAVLNSSKEKPIIKVLLNKKTKPNCWKKFYLIYSLVYISDSMDEFRQLSLRNIVVSS